MEHGERIYAGQSWHEREEFGRIIFWRSGSLFFYTCADIITVFVLKSSDDYA
jgi:hypothetical protein